MKDNLIYVLKALSDETRLRIMNLLYERELCVCDILELLNITQAKASRHLNYLKNSGLVTDRKQAQWSYYSINRNGICFDFIDILVYKNLRNHSKYIEDLKKLDKRIAGADCSC